MLLCTWPQNLLPHNQSNTCTHWYALSASLEVKSLFNSSQYRNQAIVMPQNKRGSRSKTPKSQSSLNKWETTEYIYEDPPPLDGGESQDASQDEIPLTELEQENVRKMAREFLANHTQGEWLPQPEMKLNAADTSLPP
jgi:hypothetical protein